MNELIIVLIGAITAAIFGVFLVLLEAKKTFKAERIENNRQFLYQAELESVNKMIGHLNECIPTVQQISLTTTFIWERNYLDWEREINKINISLENIDLYIYFTPSLKNKLDLVHEKLKDYYNFTHCSFFDEGHLHQSYQASKENKVIHLDEDLFEVDKVLEKEKLLCETLVSLRRDLIESYGEKMQKLMQTTFGEEIEKKWYHF